MRVCIDLVNDFKKKKVFNDYMHWKAYQKKSSILEGIDVDLHATLISRSLYSSAVNLWALT